MSNEAIKLSQYLPEIASYLNDEIISICDRKVGFTLIVFTEGRANYISNVLREDSVCEIKKLLELWDKGMPDVPAHKVI
jgi:hypothetical protein